MQSMIRAITIATFACLISCKNGSHQHAPSDVEPILSRLEVAQLGFKTRAVRAPVQSKWDQEHFGSASIVEQDIRSLNPMAEDPSCFPRYTIIRETYDNPQAASNRLRNFRDHDPDLNSKMNPKLVLRDGFASGENIWFVTTDAVIFYNLGLQKVKMNLEALKKPQGQQPAAGQPATRAEPK